MQFNTDRHIYSKKNVFENCYVAPTPEDELIEDFNGNKLYPARDGGIYYLKGYIMLDDDRSRYTRVSAINGAVF